MRASPERGFSLVEMVIAISLTGLVAVLLTLMGSRYMEGYLAAQSRASLASDAGLGLAHLRRDLRAADPLSLRANGDVLEFRREGADKPSRIECRDGEWRAGTQVWLDKVQACRFHVRPAQKGSPAIVTAWLSAGETGESVALLDQIDMPSRP
jgi:prepilin-type N-terminal cleavage/methylation domain-containing protein